MNQVMRVDQWRLYGGMRLRDHPCDVFLDNPLFSELLFPNPGNPAGTKTWGRFVRQTGQRNCAFVPEQPGTPADWQRLQRAWQRAARTTQTLDAVWGGWRDVREQADLPWLIVCPRDEIMQYWYQRSLASWLTAVCAHLDHVGHGYEIRHKPDRKHRRLPEQRVIWSAQQYRGVITAHSVSAIDALLAGRPAIVWGQDPTLGCGTPWADFLSAGTVLEPDVQQIQTAAQTWAKTTYPTLETERAVRCVMKS